MEGLDMNALPPGFGFHPTDAELVSHYLKRKIMGLQDCVIPEVDIYKHEPWDLPARSGIPSRDGKWHFFNVRGRKYPNGSRSNRATEKGYWKSTGKDRMIRSRNRNIGTKKTLVFHEGRPPMGKRTDWIMHEYYLDEKECKSAGIPKDSFVLCRVTKRNNFALEDEGHCEKEIVDAPLTPLPHKGDQMEPFRQKVEPQSSSEHEYYEDWFKELYYDLDFPMDVSSAANEGEKADLNSGAVPLMMLEPENLPLPNYQNFSDNIYRWPEVYAAEFPSTNIFDPLDSDFPAIFMNSIQGVEGMPANEEVSTSGVTEVSSDTGIVVRQRTPRATTVEPSRQRIKLQVHKMEIKKAGVLKQIVQWDSCDHCIDSDDSTEVHHVFDTKNSHGRKFSEEVTVPTVSETITDETYVTKDASMETGEETGFASCYKKDSSKWHNVKRSLRGVLKEACSLMRTCSGFGSNHLLVGTCLVGAAAMAAYLRQEDD